MGIPFTYYLSDWVRVTGDAHITRVFGNGDAQNAGMPISLSQGNCLLNFTNMSRMAARDSMWTITHFHPFSHVVISF